MLVSSSREEAAIRSAVIVREIVLGLDAGALGDGALDLDPRAGEALLDPQPVDDGDLERKHAHHLPIGLGGGDDALIGRPGPLDQARLLDGGAREVAAAGRDQA